VTLFAPKQIGDVTGMRLDEDIYSYLSRSSRRSMASTREVLERWFATTPATQQENLRGRLTSVNDEQFMSAFWEMYLATLFSQMGCTVEWEPTIPVGEGRPDFLIEGRGCCFYVEATSVGAAAVSRKTEHRVRRAYEAIRGWDLPDFMLDLTLDAAGPQDLRIDEAKMRIQPWLATLDAEEVIRQRGSSNYFEVPVVDLRMDGWAIEVRALPRAAGQRGPGQPALGSYDSTGWKKNDSDTRLRKRAEDKAKKYGVLPHPYVIAVLANTEPSTGTAQIATALWGRWTFEPDGFIQLHPLVVEGLPIEKALWRRGSGSRYTRVAAVLVATFLHPWSLSESIPTVWTNSAADPALGCDLGLPTWTEQAGHIEYSQGLLSGGAAVSLPDNWRQPDV